MNPRIKSHLAFGCAVQIQRQLLQNLFIAHGWIPAVGGEDGGVEFAVGEVEPGGAFVVEVGERAFFELIGALFVVGDYAGIADGADAIQIKKHRILVRRAF